MDRIGKGVSSNPNNARYPRSTSVSKCFWVRIRGTSCFYAIRSVVWGFELMSLIGLILTITFSQGSSSAPSLDLQRIPHIVVVESQRLDAEIGGSRWQFGASNQTLSLVQDGNFILCTFHEQVRLLSDL